MNNPEELDRILKILERIMMFIAAIVLGLYLGRATIELINQEEMWVADAVLCTVMLVAFLLILFKPFKRSQKEQEQKDEDKK